jgi:hypothetical protein
MKRHVLIFGAAGGLLIAARQATNPCCEDHTAE